MVRKIKNLKENTKKPVIFKILVVAVCFMLVPYFYLSVITISKTIDGRENSKDLEKISQQCQDLETTYLNLENKIDIEQAHQLGFVDQGEKTQYILRQGSFALR